MAASERLVDNAMLACVAVLVHKRAMFPELPSPDTTVSQVAEIVQLAVAPVFLLAGIGAFLNVCAGRLARIVDRARELEPRILASRGAEHDRLQSDLKMLDRRMALVSRALSLSVFSALVTCAVVVLLFAGSLMRAHFGTSIALLFIVSMIALGLGFAVFLIETRVAARALRIRTDILEHQADERQ